MATTSQTVEAALRREQEKVDTFLRETEEKLSETREKLENRFAESLEQAVAKNLERMQARLRREFAAAGMAALAPQFDLLRDALGGGTMADAATSGLQTLLGAAISGERINSRSFVNRVGGAIAKDTINSVNLSKGQQLALSTRALKKAERNL